MRKYVKKIGIGIVVCCLFFNTVTYSAYMKNGFHLSNPGNIVYMISNTIAQYTTMLREYTEVWEGEYGEAELVFNQGVYDNIYLYGDLTIETGKYAVTYCTVNDRNTITFYKMFNNASNSIKYEVITHEVGHALGLAHCQDNRVNYSVMRATGFNGKPWPLEDDIDGIIDIYGGE
ncbi:MAG: matrixin family metalloprotease [Agathobacter sp.]|nr:matrixin family metalloprotease [Agathobacter sp.]